MRRAPDIVRADPEMEDPELKSMILVQLQRISRNLDELEVALILQETPWGRIYSTAQEIVGHAAEIMRLSKAHSRREAAARLEAWKQIQEEAQQEARL